MVLYLLVVRGRGHIRSCVSTKLKLERKFQNVILFLTCSQEVNEKTWLGGSPQLHGSRRVVAALRKKRSETDSVAGPFQMDDFEGSSIFIILVKKTSLFLGTFWLSKLHIAQLCTSTTDCVLILIFGGSYVSLSSKNCIVLFRGVAHDLQTQIIIFDRFFRFEVFVEILVLFLSRLHTVQRAGSLLRKAPRP